MVPIDSSVYLCTDNTLMVLSLLRVIISFLFMIQPGSISADTHVVGACDISITHLIKVQ